MANSYQEYTSGLTGTSFTGFNVKSISQGHLKVATSTDNGTTYTTGALTVTVNGTTATTSSAPSTGSDGINKIRIYRSTGTAELVDFQSGSRITESDLDTSYRHAVYAAQEVLENASSTASGLQGPAGATGVGIDQITTSKVGLDTTVTIKLDDTGDSTDKSFVISDGAAGTAGAAGAFSNSFESSIQSIPAKDTDTGLAHGLSVSPKLFFVVLKCTSSELGYSVNDEVQLFLNPSSGNNLAVWATSAKVEFRREDDIYVLDKSSASGTLATINTTKWGLVFRAYA